MITRTQKPCWKIGDCLFEDVDAAQRYALQQFIAKILPTATAPEIVKNVTDDLLKEKDALVDLLTMKPTSKPAARAINGGKKTRKPKTDAAPASAPALATA